MLCTPRRACRGGFDAPRSKASAVYQIILGIILLVTISTYTGNVAAFITVSVQPTLSVESINDAIANTKRVCIDELTYLPTTAGAGKQLDALYPFLQYEVIASTAQTGEMLSDSECDGVIVGKQQYDEWRMEEDHCLSRIAQTIFPATAGWVSQCLGNQPLSRGHQRPPPSS